jgi:hypothetical protein
MLSLKHCRKVLGNDFDAPDEELAKLREQLYTLAGTIADFWLAKRVSVSDSGLCQSAKRLLPDDQIETIEERAAVIEFDGNYERDEAERLAIKSTLEV